jgi:hypothetical protein
VPISEVLTPIDALAESIAQAVNEQATATKEIARNATEVAAPDLQRRLGAWGTFAAQRG